MTRYRCGPLGENGCGAEFDHYDGPNGLSAPTSCPVCCCTFCGYECCGNVAEDLDLLEALDAPAKARDTNTPSARRVVNLDHLKHCTEQDNHSGAYSCARCARQYCTTCDRASDIPEVKTMVRYCPDWRCQRERQIEEGELIVTEP